jgi:tight adherence protein B
MDIIVRGLRAGLSSNHCFIQIVNDSDPVVSEQFLALVDDYKLGMTTEQVMNRFMKRMPLKEVSFFCLSVMIQSKTGGNLAEIIHNLSKILRNRKSILLKIQTLSSEAKSSAMIMGCLPIAIVLLLSFMAPEYMKILTHTESGKMVMACCAGWMGVGGLIMRSMINFYR